jgi:signal transduction histidine kinase
MAGGASHNLGAIDFAGIPGDVPEPQAFSALLAEYDRALSSSQSALAALTRKVEILADEIDVKNRELARAERLAALGEMAAGVAHEIRNPLGGISLYLEMLSNDVRDNQSAIALCSKISTAVSRLNHIVEAILGFTRQLEPQPSRIESAWLVDEALGMARPLLESTGVSPKIEIAVDAGHFDADPGLLHQLMLNLIRNAAEASPKRGVVEIGVRRIQARSGPSNRHAAAGGDGAGHPKPGTGDVRHFVELSVRDCGNGIEDTVKAKLFQPFASTKKGGTGLGLAFCQRIAEAHGGTINGDNHPDGGAVFTVRLPCGAG